MEHSSSSAFCYSCFSISPMPPLPMTTPSSLSCDLPRSYISLFFFFNDTATTEIYTLSLHDALPIYAFGAQAGELGAAGATQVLGVLGHHFVAVGNDRLERLRVGHRLDVAQLQRRRRRSEEHTSELQSLTNLVCRLLLEKKKTITKYWFDTHQVKEAVSALQQLITIDRYNFEAYDLFGQTYQSVCDYEKASGVYVNFSTD